MAKDIPRKYTKNYSLDGLFYHYNIKNYDDIDLEDIGYDFKLLEQCLLNFFESWSNLNLYGVEDYKTNSLYLLNENSIRIIHTFFSFMELEDFALEGLVFLPELNGKKYSDLGGFYKRRLRNVSINLTYFMEEDKESIENLKKLF